MVRVGGETQELTVREVNLHVCDAVKVAVEHTGAWSTDMIHSSPFPLDMESLQHSPTHLRQMQR